MRQDARGCCARMTQRDGMGRELWGGFRMGNTCTHMADSSQCMAKPIQCCKVKKKVSREKNKPQFWERLRDAAICKYAHTHTHITDTTLWFYLMVFLKNLIPGENWDKAGVPFSVAVCGCLARGAQVLSVVTCFHQQRTNHFPSSALTVVPMPPSSHFSPDFSRSTLCCCFFPSLSHWLLSSSIYWTISGSRRLIHSIAHCSTLGFCTY